MPRSDRSETASTSNQRHLDAIIRFALVTGWRKHALAVLDEVRREERDRIISACHRYRGEQEAEAGRLSANGCEFMAPPHRVRARAAHELINLILDACREGANSEQTPAGSDPRHGNDTPEPPRCAEHGTPRDICPCPPVEPWGDDIVAARRAEGLPVPPERVRTNEAIVIPARGEDPVIDQLVDHDVATASGASRSDKATPDGALDALKLAKQRCDTVLVHVDGASYEAWDGEWLNTNTVATVEPLLPADSSSAGEKGGESP